MFKKKTLVIARKHRDSKELQVLARLERSSLCDSRRILRQSLGVESLSTGGVACLIVRSSSKSCEKGECRLVNDRFLRRQGAMNVMGETAAARYFYDLFRPVL